MLARPTSKRNPLQISQTYKWNYYCTTQPIMYHSKNK